MKKMKIKYMLCNVRPSESTVASPPSSNYQHLRVRQLKNSSASHIRWPFSSRCRHKGSRALGKAKKLTWLGLGLSLAGLARVSQA